MDTSYLDTLDRDEAVTTAKLLLRTIVAMHIKLQYLDCPEEFTNQVNTIIDEALGRVNGNTNNSNIKLN